LRGAVATATSNRSRKSRALEKRRAERIVVELKGQNRPVGAWESEQRATRLSALDQNERRGARHWWRLI